MSQLNTLKQSTIMEEGSLFSKKKVMSCIFCYVFITEMQAICSKCVILWVERYCGDRFIKLVKMDMPFTIFDECIY